MELQPDPGDESPVRFHLGQIGDQSGGVFPVGVADDERQYEGRRDRLRPVDVGEDDRVAEDLAVEGEDLPPRGEWRLFGKQNIRREEPGADLGITARV